MNTSRIEELLEQLIDKQDELIARIESLENTVEQQLTEANTNIFNLENYSSQIYDELKWWGDGETLAKQVLSALGDIESAVNETQ